MTITLAVTTYSGHWGLFQRGSAPGKASKQMRVSTTSSRIASDTSVATTEGIFCTNQSIIFRRRLKDTFFFFLVASRIRQTTPLDNGDSPLIRHTYRAHTIVPHEFRIHVYLPPLHPNPGKRGGGEQSIETTPRIVLALYADDCGALRGRKSLAVVAFLKHRSIPFFETSCRNRPVSTGELVDTMLRMKEFAHANDRRARRTLGHSISSMTLDV